MNLTNYCESHVAEINLNRWDWSTSFRIMYFLCADQSTGIGIKVKPLWLWQLCNTHNNLWKSTRLTFWESECLVSLLWTAAGFPFKTLDEPFSESDLFLSTDQTQKSPKKSEVFSCCTSSRRLASIMVMKNIFLWSPSASGEETSHKTSLFSLQHAR